MRLSLCGFKAPSAVTVIWVVLPGVVIKVGTVNVTVGIPVTGFGEKVQVTPVGHPVVPHPALFLQGPLILTC